MKRVHTRLIMDDAMRPVAVVIDYSDWLEISRLLGCEDPVQDHSPDLASLAGTIKLREDPLEYQKHAMGEWPG